MRSMKTLLLSILLPFTSTGLAETTLFEVTDGESRVLLGGTVHILHPDQYPLPDAFEQAYGEADRLYLEMDMQEANNPVFGQRLAQVMRYQDGETLATELEPALWEELQAYAEKTNFPIERLQGFDPAFVSLVMTVVESERRGIEAGVDEHFYQKARADDMPTGQLETAEEALAYMQAMTELDGNWIMRSTLDEMARFDEMMDTIVTAWREGDMDTLDQETAAPMREGAPEMYQLLLKDRNQRWLPHLEQLFEQPGTELVLVGSMHLAGPDSLLKMLAANDYEVKPYQASE